MTASTPAAGAAGRHWQRVAGCAGHYPGWFFPPAGGETAEERVAREAVARVVCEACPVRQPCLDLALDLAEPYGIWGGLNARQRRALRRRAAVVAT